MAHVHLHGRGQKLQGRSRQDLAIAYRSLTEDEKKEVIDLGKFGTYMHHAGVRSFGPRKRPHPDSKTGEKETVHMAGPAAAHMALAGGPPAPHDVDEELGVLCVPAFVHEAKAARREALYTLRRERGEDSAIADELADVAQGPIRAAIIDDLRRPGQRLTDLAASDFAAVPNKVPTLNRYHSARPYALDKCVAGSSTQKMAASFANRHVGLLDAELPRLPKEKHQRQICREAGRCVCRGAGRRALYFLAGLQKTFRTWKQRKGASAWTKKLRGADLVFCFSWEDTTLWLFH